MNRNSLDPVDDEIERLYEAHSSSVYGYIREHVRCNVQEAEDLASEVFERACRYLKDQLDAEMFPKPKSWIMKITQNVCSKYCVDTGKHAVFSLEQYASFDEEEGSPINLEDDEDGRPENVLERHELNGELSKQIAVLPLEQQRAVLLYHRDGWTLREISQAYPVGAPRAPSTVGKDLRRGIDQLRDRLSQYGPVARREREE